MYTDEGVSGTHTAKREGFNRMIEDAINGKIDLIITKSVSRFARNTVDSLTKIRELKDHGVEVYFEKENIWTFDSKGEVLLTIMSSLAQEESRSISENVTWGWRKRFEDGKVSVAYSHFLGYDKGENGTLVINKEQAEIVKRIFNMFLEDYGIRAIACTLTDEKVIKPSGRSNWTPEDIKRILRNEKYAGNAILQKTYKVDLLSKRRINNGELKKYYVEGAHEAIISQEQFDLVQAELRRRSASPQQGVSSKHLFSGKVFCGECGAMYGSKVWHSNDKYRSLGWCCNNKYGKTKICSTPKLKNSDLETVFLSALGKLSINRKQVSKDLKYVISVVLNTTELENQLRKLNSEISDTVILLNQGVGGQPIKDSQRYDDLYARYVDLSGRAKTLADEINDKTSRKKAINKFLSSLDDSIDDSLKEFDATVFRGLCEKITVYSTKRIVVTFKSGYETEETLISRD